MSKYYVIVASLDHVMHAVSGGFIQANHGKQGPMSKLREGDRIVCYCPRREFGKKEAFQKFCALGTVQPGEAYIGDMGHKDFQPYRRDVQYIEDVGYAPIRPLIEQLSFITDSKKWGFPFRRGFFAIDEADFHLIETSMINATKS